VNYYHSASILQVCYLTFQITGQIPIFPYCPLSPAFKPYSPTPKCSVYAESPCQFSTHSSTNMSRLREVWDQTCSAVNNMYSTFIKWLARKPLYQITIFALVLYLVGANAIYWREAKADWTPKECKEAYLPDVLRDS